MSDRPQVMEKTAIFLEMIKVSHTIFALPFAVGCAFIAAGGLPQPLVLGQIVLAVLFARTAAMAFNRWADRDIDARNPRTAGRAIPAGLLSAGFVLGATLVSVVAFVAVCWWINPLALKLSPVALAVTLGYSLAKRHTFLCHVILGLALAIAPMGAWVAVTGRLDWEPVVLGLAVLLWTAGFDVIYACQDFDVDRREGLHSIPARLGIGGSLRLAKALHGVMVLVLFGLGFVAGWGTLFLGTVALITALLIYEHSIVRSDDLTRVNQAFFTVNGIISVTLMTAMILTALEVGP